MPRAAHFLFLLASLWASSTANWMELPYEDDSFNTREEYLENATLTCENEYLNATEGDFWILPDMTVMFPKERREFLTIDGPASWEVSDNGDSITIGLIQESQFGFYLCAATVNYTQVFIKKALNYKGPHFGDLWAKYEKSVIISCSAAGGFLVLAISLCWLYSWKYPDEVEPLDDDVVVDELGRVKQANNFGVDMEEQDEVKQKGGASDQEYDNAGYSVMADGQTKEMSDTKM